MMRVLIVDDLHPVLEEKLSAAGFLCNVRKNISRDEVMSILPDYEGLIIRSKFPVDNSLIDAAANLKFIGRAGAGMESIDVDHAASKGIKCFNSPEGNRDAVGEQATGMLLAMLNKICQADLEVREGLWQREKNRGIELKGKTVAIIGYGNTGSMFAKKLSGFEVKVISYDKYKNNYEDGFTREVDMQEIFDKADIVSLHVPLTPETRYLVDINFLSGFKKNIFLINTSRGPVVNTRDLVNALSSGKIIGAALDVIEYEETTFEKIGLDDENKVFTELKLMPNIVLTPHIAGWTHESYFRLSDVLADKIIAAFCTKK